MKYKILLSVTLCITFITCLVVFPSGSSRGAINGMEMCCNVIIPSLFPFTVAALFLFKCGIIDRVARIISRATRLVFKMNGQEFCVFIMSCLGGYPVGAQLIENLYVENKISRRKGELMLSYCVNSGPSYIILAVGAGILSSKTLGYILFISSFTASVIIAFIAGLFSKDTDDPVPNKTNNTRARISDTFVDATYDATSSMIKISAFVILFSSVLGLLNEILPDGNIKNCITFFSEITNAIISGPKNIYAISFLLGFAGICVHLQVIAICKSLKMNYFRFLISRIIHGITSSTITYCIVRIFHISVPAISQNISLKPSAYSILFSVALFVCAVVFMGSMQNKLKTG